MSERPDSSEKAQPELKRPASEPDEERPVKKTRYTLEEVNKLIYSTPVVPPVTEFNDFNIKPLRPHLEVVIDTFRGGDVIEALIKQSPLSESESELIALFCAMPESDFKTELQIRFYNALMLTIDDYEEEEQIEFISGIAKFVEEEISNYKKTKPDGCPDFPFTDEKVTKLLLDVCSTSKDWFRTEAPLITNMFKVKATTLCITIPSE